MLRTLYALSVLSSLAFLGLFAWAFVDAVDVRERERYGAELARLRGANAELDRAVLEARLGMLGHYDPLVSADRAVQSALAGLARLPRYVRGDAMQSLEAAHARASQVFGEKRERIERFKSREAAVRNSARYLPTTVSELLAHDLPPETREAAHELFAAVSKFMQAAEPQLEAEVRSRAARFAAMSETIEPLAVRRAANHVVLHTRLLIAHKPELDALVGEILALPAASQVDLLEQRQTESYEAALDNATARRWGLFVLSLLALGFGAAYVILRSHRTGRVLSRALGELEKAHVLLAKERDRERELSELKSRFAARTSHEFRTPLSIIMSSAELLAKYGTRFSEAKREEHRSRIEASVREMTALLDEILAAWRDDAEGRFAQPERTDAVALSRSIAFEVADGMAARQRVEVVAHQETLEAELDPRLTRHILTNLVSNAIKYSPSTTRVTVEVTREADALVLSVEDHGRGIPEADQVHLFEDFHRGSNVESITGTGLGLSVARRAAEAQGGEIQVTSREGHGTRFVVRLPLRSALTPEGGLRRAQSAVQGAP